ncbi:MAG TPA: translation initiation factor IF-2 [Candidatus Paceibacterota bacterium]|nr:translation initiation factor IF-2 [Candidatus Paceibacterota bacterium]
MPKSESIEARPPIVAVVGHIDHGKSTLLDYIRRSNVAEGEAGGITQHLSAYEASHENATGTHKITFLDTPGHEAFAAMRSRGLEVADVAILVVSAEDGVKPQTVEAVKLINEVKIPYIVAFTKVDKPAANVEKAKMSLLEAGVFLEGLGGEVPFVAVSGKTGEGVPELLDLILLAGELEGLTADASLPGSGLIIEGHVDGKRGNTATLIVLNGSIKSGEYVISGESFAPVRIMENFLGKKIKEALPGSPVTIVGFSSLPKVGDTWRTVESKKEAESEAQSALLENRAKSQGDALTPGLSKASPLDTEEEKVHVILPLVIKTDVAGVGEAVVHEIEKLPQDERLEVRIVTRAVGAVSEGDVRQAGAGAVPGIIVGFNVKVDREAQALAERLGVKIEIFSIIYKLAEWLGKELETRRPLIETEVKTGEARVIKVFSNMKDKYVLGGKVESGTLKVRDQVKVMRKEVEVARGEVIGLQSNREDVKKVEAGQEFGAQIRLSEAPQSGDYIETFEVAMK